MGGRARTGTSKHWTTPRRGDQPNSLRRSGQFTSRGVTPSLAVRPGALHPVELSPRAWSVDASTNRTALECAVRRENDQVHPLDETGSATRHATDLLRRYGSSTRQGTEQSKTVREVDASTDLAPEDRVVPRDVNEVHSPRECGRWRRRLAPHPKGERWSTRRVPALPLDVRLRRAPTEVPIEGSAVPCIFDQARSRSEGGAARINLHALLWLRSSSLPVRPALSSVVDPARRPPGAKALPRVDHRMSGAFPSGAEDVEERRLQR